jgi:hypothetical protein
MTERIRGQSLTTFEVARDGSRISFNVLDEAGKPGGLSLPVECLTQLIMTLPQVAERALRARLRDESACIAYALGSVRMEPADFGDVTLLTLQTPDGFAVSFALTAEDIKGLVEAGQNALSLKRPAGRSN